MTGAAAKQTAIVIGGGLGGLAAACTLAARGHSGTVGVGGVYDLWRRTKAWLTGRKFEASHGPGES